MTEILLIVLVLSIGLTGLAWTVIPLLQRIPWSNEKSDVTIDADLERSLQMLKDLQAITGRILTTASRCALRDNLMSCGKKY